MLNNNFENTFIKGMYKTYRNGLLPTLKQYYKYSWLSLKNASFTRKE